MTFKIGILGLIGSGKDAFAGMLRTELNTLLTQDLQEGLFNLDSYAAPLKELTSKIFGLSLDQLEDRVIKEKPKQINRDVMLEEVFHCLERVLKFNDEELDKASHLYFEIFASNRAMSPREFQQLFGTEVVRKVKRSAWRDRVHNRNANLIVPDVRFDNELCDINILVERFENIDRPKHESEQLAWDYQFTGKMYTLDKFWIVNNRHPLTLNELRDTARNVAKQILGA